MNAVPFARVPRPNVLRARVSACQSPRGFTLFEVLIALSLSLMLIAAIYSGLNLYWRYSSAGQADVERAQLARAVMRRIELDVRSVMFRPAPPASSSSQSSTSGSSGGGGSSGGSGSTSGGGSSGGSGGGSGSGSGGGSGGGSGSGSGGSSGGGSGGSSGSGSGSSSAGQSTTTTSATATEDLYGTSNTGLFGTATTLLMHVSRPGREHTAMTLAMVGNDQTRTSDLATVSYFLGGSGTGTLQGAASGSGLARLEGDRLALSMADQQSNVATMAAHTEILAPEVTALRFMYYDGFRWRSDWDSSVLGGLPLAIDVEIALRPHAGHSQPGLQAASSTAGVYKLVIPMPLGKPIDTATIQTQ